MKSPAQAAALALRLPSPPPRPASPPRQAQSHDPISTHRYQIRQQTSKHIKTKTKTPSQNKVYGGGGGCSGVGLPLLPPVGGEGEGGEKPQQRSGSIAPNCSKGNPSENLRYRPALRCPHGGKCSGSRTPNSLKGNSPENLVLSNRPCLLSVFAMDNTAARRFDSTKLFERIPFRKFGAIEPQRFPNLKTAVR